MNYSLTDLILAATWAGLIARKEGEFTSDYEVRNLVKLAITLTHIFLDEKKDVEQA